MKGRTLLLVFPIALAVACSAAKPHSLGTAGTAASAVKVTGTAAKIVEGARKQLVKPAFYDGRYASIGYPNGDVGPERGVCTDVVIRSLRHAGYDLQRLIHEDMGKRFKEYPRREAHPDSNIDHRRVPNIAYFFKKHGKSLAVDSNPNNWIPGDFVAWKLAGGKDHIGVISDRRSSTGVPLVIHNIGTVAEEDCLFAWTIIGHYRYPVQ